MSNVERINRAAQQQSARQGTHLDDLLPKLTGADLELATTIQLLINNVRRQERRADNAEKQAYREHHRAEVLQAALDAI